MCIRNAKRELLEVTDTHSWWWGGSHRGVSTSKPIKSRWIRVGLVLRLSSSLYKDLVCRTMFRLLYVNTAWLEVWGPLKRADSLYWTQMPVWRLVLRTKAAKCYSVLCFCLIRLPLQILYNVSLNNTDLPLPGAWWLGVLPGLLMPACLLAVSLHGVLGESRQWGRCLSFLF